MNELNGILRCDLRKELDYYNVTEGVQSSSEFISLRIRDVLQKGYNAYNESVEGWNNTTRLEASETKGSHYGNLPGLDANILTGIIGLILLIIDVAVSNQLVKRGPPAIVNSLRKICSGKTFSRTFVLTILVVVLPLVSILLMLSSIYKTICYLIIKRTDINFAGLLSGFDVFWSLEDDATKSIINVLGVIEADCPLLLASNIKEKLRSIVDNERVEKIFYRRYERYGYHYWQRNSVINIDKYVELVQSPGCDKLDVSALENLMTDVQEKPLPYKDKGLFQILITSKRIGKYDGVKGEYGIVFRIHHSVGDGVALIEFLCQSLADPFEDTPVKMFSMPCNNGINSSLTLLDMVRKFCQMLICFVDGILRKPDQNPLHGETLMGKKIFRWKTTSDKNLLAKVKGIRNNVDNLKFTDVLVKALSSALHNYCKQRMANIPEEIATIIPVRFLTKAVKSGPIFTNDFTVTALDVPLRTSDIDEIKNRCHELRKSADPLMNYYFLNLATSIFPSWILSPLLRSVQATLVLSNMPGTDRISICGGNELKSLVFFVPNKGTTGLGITALCYGGVLRLAAMADAAVVSRPEDLDTILDDMVEEIMRMHQLYVA